ncbi:MAG: nucleotide sugar dehydrogenase [Candidatus Omnitrophica bacterium]|nr:nucleotide sugar dehydrogenase [Candidatus Omnitrophota bacterium]MDD5672384.1 nucleotide sugar dehydrogenase [Candidatus Omnitrophota bacterium]
MSESARHLKRKILEQRAKIAIVGLGYVGLPLACEFALKGFRVTGIDIDTEKIRAILKGKSYVGDVPSAVIAKLVKKGSFRAVCDYQCLNEKMDVVIVCVPTPLNRAKDPDISFIVNATEEIRKHLQPEELVILESTTYPGTTEEVILPALESSGLKVGEDFFLCFSPERIDPGNPHYQTHNIPKVVGGVSPTCTDLAACLYGQITPQVIQVSSPRTAEMTKLLENTFRIVNIGLVNELARAAGSLGVNIWEAIDAAKTKPFGYMAFYPGPGIGGHCIGIDPLYLSWKARLHGMDLNFIDLARRMNVEMPQYVVSQAVYALNKHCGKAISRSRVMLLGVSYKKDVSDMRESPALDILALLKKLGAMICYHDPYVPEVREDGVLLKSLPLTPGNLKKQDLVILTTDHTCWNRNLIVRHSRLIFDTRNAFKDFSESHIVRL